MSGVIPYLAFRLILILAGVLPHRLQYFLADQMAFLYRIFSKKTRLGIQSNLEALVGPGSSSLPVLTGQAFRSFARYLCEFFRPPEVTQRFLDRAIKIEGREYLDQALAKGRGCILSGGHYSNWELCAFCVARLGYPLVALTQSQPHPRLNRLFDFQREAQGVEVVHTERGARRVLRALRANRPVAILGDRVTGGPVIEVEFCGRQTPLPQGPWRLALATGAPLIPAFPFRRADGGYTLRFEPPLVVPGEGVSEGRMRALAQAWATSFEAHLRNDPGQWAVFFPLWRPTTAGEIPWGKVKTRG